MRAQVDEYDALKRAGKIKVIHTTTYLIEAI